MARGAAVRMAVMGDSISAPSSTNWIGQPGTSFPGAIAFQNKAIGGATTDSIISTNPKQLAAVITLAQTNQIDDSVLVIGGNNATGSAAQAGLLSGNYAPFISNYVDDVKQILGSVALAGPGVRQVFGNMPDVTVTPSVQSIAASQGIMPAQLQTLSVAIGQANSQANAYALSHNIPVIDMYTASHTVLSGNSFALGGHTYTTPFASDQFHPGTWVQGLLANMVTTASNLQWHQGLPILSDQQIVRNTGFTPGAGTTYYNVTPLILLPVPEPSTWALAAIGTLVFGCHHATRRVRCS